MKSKLRGAAKLLRHVATALEDACEDTDEARSEREHAAWERGYASGWSDNGRRGFAATENPYKRKAD